MGINLTKTKLLAFGMGATFGGIGGVLFASRIQFIDPTNFSFDVSVSVLIVIILGGMGSIPGVIVAAFLLVTNLGYWQATLETISLVGFGAIDKNGAQYINELQEASSTITDFDCSQSSGCNAGAQPDGELGAGGMGDVYRGRARRRPDVAVKIIKPELSQDPAFQARFMNEIAAARRIRSNYVAGVIDAAKPDERPLWLACELVDGPSLARSVANLGKRPIDEVANIGAGLARALQALGDKEPPATK
jgi:hypothetical protein